MADTERRLLAAVLLRACLDAAEGDGGALAWLGSDQARAWAELVGLDRWPPAPGQLARRSELEQRARLLATD